MGQSWFGSLSLAYKYAVVFGSLLGLVLVAGSIKVVYDRRKLKKHTQRLGLEVGSEIEDETALTMREKDAGDLFGIRAIEAGYFGGVAQSQPPSLANSPVMTPRESLADFSKSGSPSLSPLQRRRTISVSSSILDLGKFAKENADFLEASASAQHRSQLKNSALTAESPIDGHYSPRSKSLSPPSFNTGKQLRPSTAERTGRHSHSPAVNMSIEVPPSPLLPSHPSSGDISLPNSNPHASVVPSDQEYPDSQSSIFRQIVIPEYYAPQPPQLTLPEFIGNGAFEVPDIENPYSNKKSMRGSIVSRATSSNGRSRGPPSPPLPEIPAINLPAFPAKAVIDSSSPKFSGFVKERSPGAQSLYTPSSHSSLTPISIRTVRGYFEIPISRPSSPPITPPPKSPRRPSVSVSSSPDLNANRKEAKQEAANADSPRTSFSYSHTNPEYTGLETTPVPRKYRIGDIPISSLSSNPINRPVHPLTDGFYAPTPPKKSPARLVKVRS